MDSQSQTAWLMDLEKRTGRLEKSMVLLLDKNDENEKRLVRIEAYILRLARRLDNLKKEIAVDDFFKE